ncbi:MAG: PQQ-binding-like beta-propeller repeat protein [Bauldia sp.]|nr:PQQ-binding-like beta-propeller repeat protein [Bauldia sp.]
MKIRYGVLMLTAAASALAFAPSASAQAPEGVPSVTPDRLRNADAEPENWLMAYGNWSNWHYSGLDQITPDNVAGLRVVYMASIGGCARPQSGGVGTRCNEVAQPLVDHGIIYLNDNQGRVMAFDATSGDRAYPLWRFDPQVPVTSTDRGIALYGDWVIQSTGGPESGGGDNNARIIAIDRQSGESVWEVTAQEVVGPGNPNNADEIASHNFPGNEAVIETAEGKQLIIVGTTGNGIGYVGAYDANNGDLVWRTYTIPQPGEPNFGTWPGETWRTGAAHPWGAPASYDPETNLVFKGTGEPSPVYDPEYRPGDNLYSVATLALDAETGAIRWYFQEVPNDQWDYDSTSSRMLIPVTQNGTTTNVVANWARNGFFYELNAADGTFINAVAQVDNINWTAGIDPKTGKPVEYNPEPGILQNYGVAGPRRGRSEADAPAVCATWGGGTTGIWPGSYDPTTGITYNTRTTGCTYQTITRTTDEAFNPMAREGLGSVVRQVQVDTKFALIAIDTNAGVVANTFIRDQEIPSDRQAEIGALATAGGLVFTAGDDGRVSAHDSATLEELWHFSVGTGMKGGIMSFGVNGNQYIAKIVGGDNPGSSGIRSLIQPSAMLVVWGL